VTSTLVIMAAGLGSRFGGTKQLAGVGPDGAALIDYTIDDAVAGGVGRVVVIVRSEIEALVSDHLGPRHPDVDFVYVRQDDLGRPRDKPWGTGHAVLAAADAVDGPFLVCNADDYYGRTTPALLAHAAEGLAPDRAVLAGFRLDKTLPATGEVSRGVCRVDGDELLGLVETHGIGRRSDGTITATDPAGRLAAETVISMNYWAFPEHLMDDLEVGWQRFLAEQGDDATAEFLLPGLVGELVEAGKLTVGVVPTEETWVGITNPDDLEIVREAIAGLRA
jgi:NDP-sugar pyrophosphorylase family protein